MRVDVRGSGLAGHCCAYLLGKSNIDVAFQSMSRVPVPAIMLGESTQALIAGVYENSALFANLHRIEKRIVAWGAGEVKTLPHSAVIISEQVLRERLGNVSSLGENSPVDWTVHASAPLPAGTAAHGFGSRLAAATPVVLKACADGNACWVESTAGGWLFLTPSSPREAWLLAVGEGTETLLADSRLIVNQIQAPGPVKFSFPAYPKIADPPCGPGWLACGTAAMAFDPLCGDGTGHAIREGILAAAVIGAVARGAPPESLLSHYRTRLLAGFARHLNLCVDFYRSGHQGKWWETELNSLQEGWEWCQRELRSATPFEYQLIGFDLLALTPEPARPLPPTP